MPNAKLVSHQDPTHGEPKRALAEKQGTLVVTPA